MTLMVKENPPQISGEGEGANMRTEKANSVLNCGIFGDLEQGVVCSFRGPMTPVAYAAYSMAMSGIPVFPVSVRYDEAAGKFRKHPLTKNGHHDRTTDVEQVLAWWKQHPDASIAQVPADQGMVVIDRDLGCDDDPRSAEWLKGLPPTRVTRTPSGGEHWWYDTFGEFSNKKPAPHIDIRSSHGWVVAYPSPGYTLINNREPVPLPLAYEQSLTRGSRKTERKEIDPADTPVNIERAKQFLLSTEPAIEGQGGDQRTFAVACTLVRNIGLSPDTALMLMAEYYNPRCEPEWSDAELETKVANAAKYGTGEPDWRQATSATPAAYQSKLPPDLSINAWLSWDIPEAIRLAGPINSDSKVYVIAATGVGKTMFGMALAAHLAAGKDFCAWKVPEPKRVLYIDGEMGARLIKDRINAVIQQLGPTDLSWRDRFVMLSNAAGQPFEDLPPLDTPEGREKIVYLIGYYKADLVIIDNIDALTAGEIVTGGGIDWRGSWRNTKQLRDRLQSMGVAQVWIHHANESGEAVGDKTRGHAMDTSILLKQPEDQAGHSIEFDMVYKKHREMHENNREDYIGGRWSVIAGQWQFSGSLIAEIRLSLIGHVEGMGHSALATAITGQTKGKHHKAKENQLRRAAYKADAEFAELFELKDGKVVWRLPVKAATNAAEPF
jgi:hypothetical protein